MRWFPLNFGSMSEWVRGRLPPPPLPTYEQNHSVVQITILQTVVQQHNRLQHNSFNIIDSQTLKDAQSSNFHIFSGSMHSKTKTQTTKFLHLLPPTNHNELASN
jgi:hypothetical protein